MIFNGVNNQFVELLITNYEFPNSDDKEYDGNWLNIYIRVKSKVGNWQSVDPSLLTWEVQSIIDWFKTLSRNIQPEYSELDFIEPNLAFKFRNKASDELKSISLHFDLETRPKSALDGLDYHVECILNNEELETIAAELENELAKYPERK